MRDRGMRGQQHLPLLIAIGALFLLGSTAGMEPVAYALALGGSLVLLWGRSRELALPRDMVQVLLFPGLMLCVGLHGIYAHPLNDFLKDCWYFTLPLVYLSFGYLAFERLGRWGQAIQPMIVVGLGVGLFSLLHAALNRGELAAASSVDAYRNVTGTGTFVPMLPLVAIMFARRAQLPEEGLERFRNLRLLAYAVSTAAILITFSRTHILTLLAAMLCALNPRAVLRRLALGGGAGLLLLLLFLAGGLLLTANAKSGPLELFLTKVANSGSEVQVRPYETFEDINNNWRGYEAYRASKTYETFSPVDKIFGGGHGALVDLGFAMQLSLTQAFKYIPIMHNGYMYILVKTGIVGLCLFALFALQLFALGRGALRLRSPSGTRDPQAWFAALVLFWTPLVIMATQGVITGIYNKGELIPILFLAGAGAASYSARRRAMEAAAWNLPLRRQAANGGGYGLPGRPVTPVGAR